MLAIIFSFHPNVPPTYGDLRAFVNATNYQYDDKEEIAYSYNYQGEIDGFKADISAPRAEDK